MKQIIVWLSVYSLLFIGCENIKSADEYYTAAEIERNAKNINLSLENLDNLIKNYPDHALAPKAQYLKGDIYMNDFRDFEAAIAAYNSVVDKYNSSSEAPKAQFMIGYIFANPQFGEIQDLEKAKVSFELFLEKFPDHELAPSVKFEMENLGKEINDYPIMKNIST